MPTAPHTADLATQPRPGAGTRLLRHLGGAVCSALAGGATLASRLRRRAARPSSPSTPHTPRDAEASPQPARNRAPRRTPQAAATAVPPPARSGAFARWFGRGHGQPALQPALPRHPRFRDSNPAPFTPEAYPGLDPAFCKFLNTPLEKCDPEMLRLLLTALAPLIADALPPGSAMADAKDVFATLCERLGTAPGEAPPDAPPDAPPACAPHPEPVPPADPRPDASSAPPPEAQPAPEADAPVAAATPAAPASLRNAGPQRHDGRRSLRSRSAQPARAHRLQHRASPSPRCGFRSALPHSPLRRACYAARASPS